MGEIYHFQVNLGGMLDVLSNHLYKSPDVFLRELLQNGVDAITLRQKKQPGWTGGRLTIAVEPGKSLVVQDNGAGLNEAEIHRFLAVIGQSSKMELVNGKLQEDYIGRFGIGLLSCFMVSDSIVVHTRPADGGPAHRWTGQSDGSYTLEPLADCQRGTAMKLTAKPGMEAYFQAERVAQLVRYYGLALPVPISLNGSPERLNSIPTDFTGVSQSQLLDFGQWLFEEKFLEAIPIQTPTSAVWHMCCPTTQTGRSKPATGSTSSRCFWRRGERSSCPSGHFSSAAVSTPTICGPPPPGRTSMRTESWSWPGVNLPRRSGTIWPSLPGQTPGGCKRLWRSMHPPSRPWLCGMRSCSGFLLTT